MTLQRLGTDPTRRSCRQWSFTIWIEVPSTDTTAYAAVRRRVGGDAGLDERGNDAQHDERTSHEHQDQIERRGARRGVGHLKPAPCFRLLDMAGIVTAGECARQLTSEMPLPGF